MRIPALDKKVLNSGCELRRRISFVAAKFAALLLSFIKALPANAQTFKILHAFENQPGVPCIASDPHTAPTPR